MYICDLSKGPIHVFVQFVIELGNSIAGSAQHRRVGERREAFESDRFLLPR